MLVNGITGSIPATVTGCTVGAGVDRTAVGVDGFIVGNAVLVGIRETVVGGGMAVGARSTVGVDSSDDVNTKKMMIAKHNRTAKAKKSVAKDNTNIKRRTDIMPILYLMQESGLRSMNRNPLSVNLTA